VGTDLSIIVEVFEQKAWHLAKHWDFTTRDRTFHRLLADMECEVVPKGELSEATVAIVEEALVTVSDPNIACGVGGMRGEAFLEFFAQVRGEKMCVYGLGAELRSEELLAAEALVRALIFDGGRATRVLYWFDEFALQPLKEDDHVNSKVRSLGEEINNAVEEEPRRTEFKQPVSRKDAPEGADVLTCGHVEAGGGAYLFDGHWSHDGEDFYWMACCQACAEKSNFNIVQVSICEVVRFGSGT
jgi:hypothetical protein